MGFAKLFHKPLRLAAAAGVSVFLFFLTAGAGQDAGTVPLRMIVASSAGEARKILEQLNAGADFAVLAREKSVDATSVDGGFLGMVDPATLRAELRDALRGIEPGRISPVVKLPAGFAILEVLRPGEVADIENLERARQFAVSASASVKFDFDVSGLNDTEAALAGFDKPDGWYLDLNTACAMREQSLAAAEERAEKYLDPASAALDKNRQPFDAMAMREALGQLHAYQGEMDQAIEQWEAAYRMASAELPRALPYMDELLGLAYLHRSEMANGVYRNPGDRCIFPMRHGARYEKTADSEKAVQYLLKVAARKPEDLEVRWALNLAYMTLGAWPEGVPKQHLLPPAAFASAEDVGRFKDVAPEAGLKLFSQAGGVIVDDFDRDGLFDVVTSSMDLCAPMHFFHNNGDGTFTDCSAKAGLAGQLGGLNIIQTDYNNDGCLDILVLRGGWEIPQRKSLLRNNCDGTFTDVTKASGLAEPATATQTAVWADINNDGFLDLFVGVENGPNQLFLNQGDGTFKDIAHAAGVDRTAFTKSVVAADYDHDGYVDFYANNYRGDSALYRNNRDGTFTEIASQAGVPGTGRGFGSWFFDYDNDGWPDLFVTSYFMSTEETMRTYLGLVHNAPTVKLYKNLGNGGFRDVTAQTGLAKVFMPMGANFGDVDNDGYPDMYLGNGNPGFSSVVPHVLLRNQEGKAFVDITASSGTGELHKGHGVAFADIDNDGDEDILTLIGGAVRGDAHAFRLFENPGNGNDWVSLRLVGVQANRAALGARIEVTVENQGRGTRSIYRTVGSGASFGASPLEQHIGLGASARITGIRIWWPGNPNTPQEVAGVGKNQAVEIREGSPGYTKLARRPFRLGGSGRVP